mmetsp:Transcript_30466/g.83663  ORF Transcript_30466/g.83663 Transcript_30466/m.83663 type:complete len:235 (+) Transcript_30466:144-848(+)
MRRREMRHRQTMPPTTKRNMHTAAPIYKPLPTHCTTQATPRISIVCGKVAPNTGKKSAISAKMRDEVATTPAAMARPIAQPALMPRGTSTAAKITTTAATPPSWLRHVSTRMDSIACRILRSSSFIGSAGLPQRASLEDAVSVAKRRPGPAKEIGTPRVRAMYTSQTHHKREYRAHSKHVTTSIRPRARPSNPPERSANGPLARRFSMTSAKGPAYTSSPSCSHMVGPAPSPHW